jgi:hypothetical protein
MLRAVPKHLRPYAIPVIHLEAFKRELIHLVKIGVLSPQGASEWASPTFIAPKKCVKAPPFKWTPEAIQNIN